METSKLLLKILNKCESESNDYFKNVLVSKQKTVIKFGSIDNEQISLNFFIHGQIDENIKDLEVKINALFNTDSDLSTINDILSKIKTPCKVSFSPFLKISKIDDPLIHAFGIQIKY